MTRTTMAHVAAVAKAIGCPEFVSEPGTDGYCDAEKRGRADRVCYCRQGAEAVFGIKQKEAADA